jgi:hypothetical protein
MTVTIAAAAKTSAAVIAEEIVVETAAGDVSDGAVDADAADVRKEDATFRLPSTRRHRATNSVRTILVETTNRVARNRVAPSSRVGNIGGRKARALARLPLP